jgi:hypothetical protein
MNIEKVKELIPLACDTPWYDESPDFKAGSTGVVDKTRKGYVLGPSLPHLPRKNDIRLILQLVNSVSEIVAVVEAAKKVVDKVDDLDALAELEKALYDLEVKQ